VGGDESKPFPFFQGARLVIVDERKTEFKRPEIRVTMDGATLMVLRLAREGFGGGDPERILAMPTSLVLDAWEFLDFQSRYEATTIELNK
jgi:hypothetical protein